MSVYCEDCKYVKWKTHHYNEMPSTEIECWHPNNVRAKGEFVERGSVYRYSEETCEKRNSKGECIQFEKKPPESTKIKKHHWWQLCK